jgi:hypothetical protein
MKMKGYVGFRVLGRDGFLPSRRLDDFCIHIDLDKNDSYKNRPRSEKSSGQKPDLDSQKAIQTGP